MALGRVGGFRSQTPYHIRHIDIPRGEDVKSTPTCSSASLLCTRSYYSSRSLFPSLAPADMDTPIKMFGSPSPALPPAPAPSLAANHPRSFDRQSSHSAHCRTRAYVCIFGPISDTLSTGSPLRFHTNITCNDTHGAAASWMID